MIDIKRGRPTLRPNYALIPVTTTDNVSEWNKVFMDYSQRGYPLIEWTPSGGISLTNWRYMGFGVKSYKWGAEITAIDASGAFRLQFRSKLNDVDQIDLARAAKIDRSYLNQLEGGRKSVGWKTWAKLAAYIAAQN